MKAPGKDCFAFAKMGASAIPGAKQAACDCAERRINVSYGHAKRRKKDVEKAERTMTASTGIKPLNGMPEDGNYAE